MKELNNSANLRGVTGCGMMLLRSAKYNELFDGLWLRDVSTKEYSFGRS